MYVNFNVGNKNSSFSLFEYLGKESKEEAKNAGNFLKAEAYFFNHSYNPMDLADKNNMITINEAYNKIDENLGTQNKNNANFYMLNISPSQSELQHLEKIAIEELNNRGLFYEQAQKTPEGILVWEEQKNELLKIQLKLYTTSVMDEYAKAMDREIYANQEALPTDGERKEMNPEIETRYNTFLEEKGLNSQIEEIDYQIIENFEIEQEYEHGKIFRIDSLDLDKKINLFVPKGKYKIENKQLFINEEYYSDKYNEIVEKEIFKNEKIEITGKTEKSSEDFLDFVKEEKVIIIYKLDEFDKELKLYFNKNEIQKQAGVYFIPESVYNNKVSEAKSLFFSKKFAEKKKSIYEDFLKGQGFDVTKVKKNGVEEYLYPEKIPSKDELKKINIKTSVAFNKYLVKNGYLPKKKGLKVSNWDSRKSIDAEILVESQNAKLLNIWDSRLSEPVQIWVGNFALMDKEGGYLLKDKDGKISILSDFYEYKINEILKLEDERKLEFIDFREVESEGSKLVKKEESVSFTYNIIGLKEPLKFNIRLEELNVSDKGNYTMERHLFEHKYEKHLINQAKKEFTKDFEKITNTVNKEMLNSKDYQKEKEIEKRFRNVLVEKNILQDNSKNDQFKVEAKIDTEKEKSTMIIHKPKDYENEVKFWVNNKDFVKDGDNLVFKDERKINILIEKAVEKDKQKNQLVEIKHISKEDKEIKYKDKETKEDKQVTNTIFQVEKKGLKEPISLVFPKDEVKEIEGKFFIQKYKLEYKEKQAIEKGIKSEFGAVKEDIKNQVWKEKGFDPTKRKLEGKDLMYFAKVENDRTYKGDNKLDKKLIDFNKDILKKIEEAEKKGERVKELKEQLKKDKYTGEVIKEGVKKGGLNHHVHVVISRHDQTSKNPKDKVSISPNATQKDGYLGNGAKIGFNRSNFAKSCEKNFDRKFEYERPLYEKFEYKNTMGKYIQGKITSSAKHQILKAIGGNEIRNELDPTRRAKQELMPIPIPTRLPTGVLDASLMVLRTLKSAIIDKGMGY